MLWWTLRKLESPDPGTRHDAVSDLGGKHSLDPRVLEPLRRALADPESLVRGAAARSLARVGSPPVVEPLLRALSDPVDSVRREVSEALGVLRARAAVAPLLSRLGKEERDWERGTIVKALRAIGDAQAVAPLVAFLGKTEWSLSIRATIAEALGAIGDGSALEPIAELHSALEAKVRSAPANATDLGELLARTRKALESLDRNWLTRIRDRKAAIEDRDAALAFERLVAAGFSEEVEKSAWRIPDEKWRSPEGRGAVPALLAAVESRRSSKAIELLGKIGDPRAIEPLVAAFDRGDLWFKAHTVLEALERLAWRPDESRRVAWAAARALRSVDPRDLEPLAALGAAAVEPLLQVLDRARGAFRADVLGALAKIQDERVTRRLVAAREDPDESVRRVALMALGELREEPRLDRLLAELASIADRAPESCASSRGRAEMAIVTELGRLGDARALAPLVDYVESSTIVGIVREDLGELSSEPSPAEVAAACIHSILERSPGTASTDALEAVIEDLVSRREVRPFYVQRHDPRDYFEEERTVWLDFAKTRALAEEELRRRASVTSLCPGCGAKLTPEGRFCPGCGKPRT
jgi:HEAT repeat protein